MSVAAGYTWLHDYVAIINVTTDAAEVAEGKGCIPDWKVGHFSTRSWVHKSYKIQGQKKDLKGASAVSCRCKMLKLGAYL